ncbi:MAG: ABC-F family ATP-binding cassette domain-containing protein [Tissierellia bacterium]|nr:ABC-F family ATP-binding cassette domain-containing protein [Tissierellia bacterium]
MIVLSCNDICKTYGANPILNNISFSIRNGEKVGLIGPNGSGKTTLFNILVGAIEKDMGNIFIRRGLKIGYLKQHTDMAGDKTIYDECLQVFTPLIEMEQRLRTLEEHIANEGLKGESDRLTELMSDYSHLLEEFNKRDGYGYESEIRGILKGLGFKDEDMGKRVDILSGGQKTRLALAKLLLDRPNLLLLDEPTNHLDIDAIDWLESYMADYEGAALIISHDRYFLDNTISRIFHLENLKLSIYDTNYSMYMKERKKELELLRKQYDNQQREIMRQQEIIERFSNYGDRRYIRQAQSRQKLLDRMKLLDKPTDARSVNISFEPKVKSGRDVLSCNDVEKSFGDFKLLEDIEFNIYRGEKVGLIGPNGIGKTTLFRMILGEIPHDAGKISIGHNVNIEYFDQEQHNLDLNKTIIDEVWDDNPKLNHYQIRNILSRFLFIGDDIFREIENLSGGERGRLALLKLMLSNANFLLMDEPTNHLDIDSKEVLEDALMDYKGTLLVISHDRYFLNKVVDRILDLTETGIQEYLGNYNYYLNKKAEMVVVEEEERKTRTQIQLEKRKEREALRTERRRREDISNLEDRIEQEESELKALDELLCDPKLYDEPDKIIKLSKKRDDTQAKLDTLYKEWILLTESHIT